MCYTTKTKAAPKKKKAAKQAAFDIR